MNKTDFNARCQRASETLGRGFFRDEIFVSSVSFDYDHHALEVCGSFPCNIEVGVTGAARGKLVLEGRLADEFSSTCREIDTIESLNKELSELREKIRTAQRSLK